MENKILVIVDYGMGNLQSVLNAFKFLNCNAIISDKKKTLRRRMLSFYLAWAHLVRR